MTAYYNEHDPFAAAWLRELIKDGLIAPGDVDERSILDVTPNDLKPYTQIHLFAGIGGWSYALRKAGWPDNRPVWTGSAPCQPFSAAGKGKGIADERHLWPAFFWLIRNCAPTTIFGEQVSSKKGLAWFDIVATDLESAGYGVGAFDLCAAGAGAPHLRQRLYFVASLGKEPQCQRRGGWSNGDTSRGKRALQTEGCSTSGNVAHAAGFGRGQDEQDIRRGELDVNGGGSPTNANGSSANGCGQDIEPGVALGDSCGTGLEKREGWSSDNGEKLTAVERTSGNYWSDCEYLPCLDGKARPTKSGLFPLVDGFSNRVGVLRGAGNAIVPQVAERFICAYMEYLENERSE